MAQAVTDTQSLDEATRRRAWRWLESTLSQVAASDPAAARTLISAWQRAGLIDSIRRMREGQQGLFLHLPDPPMPPGAASVQPVDPATLATVDGWIPDPLPDRPRIILCVGQTGSGKTWTAAAVIRDRLATGWTVVIVPTSVQEVRPQPSPSRAPGCIPYADLPGREPILLEADQVSTLTGYGAIACEHLWSTYGPEMGDVLLDTTMEQLRAVRALSPQPWLIVIDEQAEPQRTQSVLAHLDPVLGVLRPGDVLLLIGQRPWELIGDRTAAASLQERITDIWVCCGRQSAAQTPRFMPVSHCARLREEFGWMEPTRRPTSPDILRYRKPIATEQGWV